MISQSKKSLNKMESLLFPVAVAHRITIVPSGFFSKNCSMSDFVCCTISSTSIMGYSKDKML
ncbi:MAG: hypothetical protein K6E76_08770 [Patescibacteria group bacterium]|nr:hypothetical protein [Patescibacteria group bacterium]